MEGNISVTFDASNIRTLNVEMTGQQTEDVITTTIKWDKEDFQLPSWPAGVSAESKAALGLAIQHLCNYAATIDEDKETAKPLLVPPYYIDREHPSLENLQLIIDVNMNQNPTVPNQVIFNVATEQFSVQNVLADILLSKMSYALYCSYLNLLTQNPMHQRRYKSIPEEFKNKGKDRGEADSNLHLSGDSSYNLDRAAFLNQLKWDKKRNSMDSSDPLNKLDAVSDLDPNKSSSVSVISSNSMGNSDDKSQISQINKLYQKSDDRGIRKEQKQIENE